MLFYHYHTFSPAILASTTVRFLVDTLSVALIGGKRKSNTGGLDCPVLPYEYLSFGVENGSLFLLPRRAEGRKQP